MKYPQKFYSRKVSISEDGSTLHFEEWDHTPTLEDIKEQNRILNLHQEYLADCIEEARSMGKKINYNGREFGSADEFLNYMSSRWKAKTN